GNHSAGGLGADLRVFHHDGRGSHTISADQLTGTRGIAHPTRPGRSHHLPAVWAAAAWIRHRVHFSFGDDWFHFRVGDPYRCKSGSQDLWTAPRPRRDGLPALASYRAARRRQLGDFHHRSWGAGPAVLA